MRHRECDPCSKGRRPIQVSLRILDLDINNDSGASNSTSGANRFSGLDGSLKIRLRGRSHGFESTASATTPVRDQCSLSYLKES